MRRKILTILGTRPEIIRLSLIMQKLDQVCEHRILHTGQNYTHSLHDVFFEELGLRKPDCQLSATGSIANQMATMFVGVEKYIEEFRPDAVLILGDTNSALTAVICERLGVPVYHMEAGNRCYDLSVPEEKNRRVVDAISSINMPYTQLSRENLLREGISNDKIVVVGNPINEVLNVNNENIGHSTVLEKFGLENHEYVIATCHRAENVDNPQRLKQIVRALNTISQQLPVVFSCHPRTQQRLADLDTALDNQRIRVCEPMGFFDWARLECTARVAITDSGTVQEEMCMFGRPTITIRQTTERPETVWCGSNIVAGLDTDRIVECFEVVKEKVADWTLPEGYSKRNVSSTVVNVLMSNYV